MPRRAAGTGQFAGGANPVQALSIDSDAIYSMIASRATLVVRRASRMALGSARERAPVRKVFSGGRRGRPPRFYSLAEAKRELPAFLRSLPRQELRGGTEGKRPMMTRTQALAQLRATPIATSRNRANSWQMTGVRKHRTSAIGPFIPSEREVKITNLGNQMAKPGAFFGLTSRGRWELKNGRSISESPERGAGNISGRAKKFMSEAELMAFKEADASSEATLGGNLRRSVHLEDRSEGDVIKSSVIAGGDDAPYARFVEFGTRHAAAQPFLRPALKHVEAQYRQMMRDAFRGVIK